MPNTPYRTLYKDTVPTDREKKNIVLLDVIRRNGPIAKTDIARITKFNIVTVSNYVENYIKQKLVTEKGLDVSSGGRRPELVELNSDWAWIIGVDISHTTISCVIAKLNSKALHRESMPRPAGHMETVLADVVKIIKKAIQGSGMDATKLKGIGVGISGVIDKNAGTVRDTDVTRGMTVGSVTAVKSMLEKEFKVPVYIGNDASLAALGEKKLSLRIDDENVLYMYGDVGAGIIAHNELFMGTSSSAGEIQLNIAEADSLGLPKWVKESNFFRSRGADMGLVEDVKELHATGVKLKLWEKVGNDLNKLTLEMILQEVEFGEPPLVQVVDKTATLLGLKIAYLVNFLNPEVVVLGGGFEKGGDIVLNRVRSIVKKLAMEESASIGRDGVFIECAVRCIRHLSLKS